MSDEAADVVVALVRDLVAEFHPQSSRVTVTLDSRFDDLGIGSLELAELLRRVQHTCGVTLGAHVLTSAETPHDLLRAIDCSSASAGQQPRPIAPPATAPDAAPAAGAATLIEALDWHVHATPDRAHIRILDERGIPEDLTYAMLHREAAAVAAGLAACDVLPGDRVAIMLPTSRAYFVTFTGVMLAGAVPVPLYPPVRPSLLADHLRRHIGILANAQATVLVTVPEAVSLGQLLRSNIDSLRHVVVPDALEGRIDGALPRPRSLDLALVQYTSGSTGQPKGVALTHQNLLANIRAMGQAAGVSSADIFVSWLPLYHDMGLIGAWLSPLYFGIPLVVMGPQAFLARPSRWLSAIHAHRATISAGPNFAYELCLAKIDDSELEGLDLSSWRLAYNGAEPVSPATIQRFTERFTRYGLRPTAMAPVYGLAESSVGLTFPPLGRNPLVDRIDRAEFAHSGRAVPAQPGPQHPQQAVSFVACGRALPGHEIRIVDSAGIELGDRREGRIEFRGPSATAGYFNNAEATDSLFHGDWLDSGDLGYMADADLYVTGRVKDMIIRAGRNLHPAELEEAIGYLEGVRKGCVAVFAASDPAGGPERLVVVAETRASSDQATRSLRAHIISTTVGLLGSAPDDVVLAPARTIPKTSSGKIRRAASREMYEQARIGAPSRPLWWELVRLRLRGVVPSLRRTRHSAAAVAFAAHAWVVFLILAVPVIILLALLPSPQLRWHMIRASARLLARLTKTEVTVHGLDHLPKPDSPVIVVPNHQSWLDGLVLATVLPRSFCFIAGEVFEHRPLSGFVLRRLGTEFVERHEREHGIADTDRLADDVRAGRSLVVFPEGALSHEPGVRPFRMGAFVVAVRTGACVLPVGIHGTRTILRPGRRFPLRGAIDIAIGPPLHTTGTDWAEAVRLQRTARDAVLRLSGEPDLQ
ncbi:AMP-binding protein [Nocardia vaccinii]|uniref:AMP-binding protein n=1 Tax=Nocardia vaccinii TaxID=1822 RepID=UPI001FE2105C|nr:AMP-binding protein [Nocardia vaccinii]